MTLDRPVSGSTRISPPSVPSANAFWVLPLKPMIRLPSASQASPPVPGMPWISTFGSAPGASSRSSRPLL
jgi:hypothetical protein